MSSTPMMFVTLRSPAALPTVEAALQGKGQWTRRLHGAAGQVAGLEIAPHSPPIGRDEILAIDGVADVLRPVSPHPRVDAQAGRTVSLGRAVLGEGCLLMAGPCSVETEAQIHAAAALVARSGARLLRGGAFKPRTSPYAFSGHGTPALQWMREAADAHGLGMVTEVLSEADVESVAAVADLLQIGSRNMQNFALLRAVGRTGRPVLLKRGMAARIEDWLLAGEHLLSAGAEAVIFCERGIQGFDPLTRNLLDLGAVALLKHALHQPVVVDPSHATGRRDLVLPLSRAAVAAGADGLLVEAHPEPSRARSDGPQALDEAGLAALAGGLGLAPVGETP
ncbi:3-deoxy-7-phosphoheptulonate synthase [Myxococcota bacterium]|nr:3-deoxy-7-phosphoheptulonate synthase [Myxococcota bacterium]